MGKPIKVSSQNTRTRVLTFTEKTARRHIIKFEDVKKGTVLDVMKGGVNE